MTKRNACRLIGYDTGSIEYKYDSYDRLYRTERSYGSFNQTENYTFTENGNNTSAQVSGHTSTVNNVSTSYAYTYDDNGNITKIVYGDGTEIRYYYDSLNQLVREDNGLRSLTFVYEYDDAGNRTKKYDYLLTDMGVTPTNPSFTYNYSYSNSGWGDQLVSYNENEITYDGSGNPLTYHNGVPYTFEWLGKNLIEAAKGGKVFEFSYNDERVRTSKTVNGVTTTYYLSGSQIIGEETSGNITVYLYDATGSVIGMQYHEAGSASTAWDIYWFEKNLQGDIVAVYDENGTKLVSYKYDAWGRSYTYSHNGTDEIAEGNPFRYRGYYYDADLELYYLGTRVTYFPRLDAIGPACYFSDLSYLNSVFR